MLARYCKMGSLMALSPACGISNDGSLPLKTFGFRPVYVSEEEFQRVPSSVHMYHAAIALAKGDVANAMEHAHKVLLLAREMTIFLVELRRRC